MSSHSPHLQSTHTQLSVTLLTSLAEKHLHPRPDWLAGFISSHLSSSSASTSSTSSTSSTTTATTTTLPSLLVRTATFRLLASDITQTLVSSSLLPLSSTSVVASTPRDEENAASSSSVIIPLFPANPSLSSPHARETKLQIPVLAQVIDILDLSSSLSAQVEEWEMIARGEGRGTTGRGSVVRIPENEGEGEDGGGGGGYDGTAVGARGAAGRQGQGQSQGRGVYKLLLQDAAGTLVWGFFDGSAGIAVVNAGALQQSVQGQGQGVINIGTKVLLERGAIVARGVVMMERGMVRVLGGRIEEMEKSWREGRLVRLKEALREQRGEET